MHDTMFSNGMYECMYLCVTCRILRLLLSVRLFPFAITMDDTHVSICIESQDTHTYTHLHVHTYVSYVDT